MLLQLYLKLLDLLLLSPEDLFLGHLRFDPFILLHERVASFESSVCSGVIHEHCEGESILVFGRPPSCLWINIAFATTTLRFPKLKYGAGHNPSHNEHANDHQSDY